MGASRSTMAWKGCNIQQSELKQWTTATGIQMARDTACTRWQSTLCVCVSLSLSLALSLYLFILPENEKRVENNALEFSFLRMGAIERNAGCLFIAIIGKVFDY